MNKLITLEDEVDLTNNNFNLIDDQTLSKPTVDLHVDTPIKPNKDLQTGDEMQDIQHDLNSNDDGNGVDIMNYNDT
eukprot:CAMPEP_0116897078 /NCGR_PEP_ID=MMETSP0467-20121206/6171_1 /TAXON_ID=283647 /ORGANISM="Mesodinium pulex, Strain SPMC105" /LENGTH=75 /DNA_ID=CAMNT_0004568587 /DNA_START=1045 /DNA_END=1272 /DNA_ORIENTATION=-